MNMQQRWPDFVRANHNLMLSFITRIMPPAASAEDILHAASEAVLRPPEFDPSRPDAVGYFRQQLRWLIYDHRHRSGRLSEPLPDTLADSRSAEPPRILEREETCA